MIKKKKVHSKMPNFLMSGAVCNGNLICMTIRKCLDTLCIPLRPDLGDRYIPGGFRSVIKSADGMGWSRAIALRLL